MNFISKTEWDELQLQHGNEDLLNEILSRVYNKAIEDTLRKIPDVISRLLKSTIATQKMSTEFYARNKSFAEHQDIVASVIQDVESRNPNAGYKDILMDSESIIRDKIKAFTSVK